eukprot:scaffold18065_cov59-Phaeocystis_antarctica.AAC.1
MLRVASFGVYLYHGIVPKSASAMPSCLLIRARARRGARARRRCTVYGTINTGYLRRNTISAPHTTHQPQCHPPPPGHTHTHFHSQLAAAHKDTSTILSGCRPSGEGKSASGGSTCMSLTGRPALRAQRSSWPIHSSMSTAETWLVASTVPPGRVASTHGLKTLW